LALDAADKKDQEILEGIDGDDEVDEPVVEEDEEFVEEGNTSMPGMLGGADLQSAMANVMGGTSNNNE
jgi:hypothetical protein